jgi:hypothetical protein
VHNDAAQCDPLLRGSYVAVHCAICLQHVICQMDMHYKKSLCDSKVTARVDELYLLNTII